MKEKIQIRNKLLFESLLALCIALTPLIFYTCKYIAAGSQEITVLFFTLTANDFADVGTALYYYLTKFIPLALLVFWFITCKHWWYHTILIPIAMYSFQLYNALIREAYNSDKNEILYVALVTMVVVPIVYLIRVKLVDKYVHGIDLNAIDAEIQLLEEKEALRKEREHLKQHQKTLSKKM